MTETRQEGESFRTSTTTTTTPSPVVPLAQEADEAAREDEEDAHNADVISGAMEEGSIPYEAKEGIEVPVVKHPVES